MITILSKSKSKSPRADARAKSQMGEGMSYMSVAYSHEKPHRAWGLAAMALLGALFFGLFIPGEAFYSAALRYEPDLFERGTAVGVILASPATLIALLKAAAYGWKQEALSKNADEIRRLGVELHERVGAVARNLDDLGQRLQQAVGAYNSTAFQAESQLFVTGRKLKKLGGGSEKEIIEPRVLDETARRLNVPELKG